MISPERLRRYPFFAGLTENQLDAIALISEDKTGEMDAIIFVEGQYQREKKRLLSDRSIQEKSLG
jgi:hypothetical protein